jgi:hypothetical protein
VLAIALSDAEGENDSMMIVLEFLTDVLVRWVRARQRRKQRNSQEEWVG